MAEMILIAALITGYAVTVATIAAILYQARAEAQKHRVEVAKMTKREADYFNQITGWQGRTNADMRDAGLIALAYSKKH